MSPRMFWSLGCVVVLFGLAKHFCTWSLGPAPIVLDAAGYWQQAIDFSQGDWLLTLDKVDYRTPLYPILLSLPHRLCGAHALAIIIVAQHFLFLAGSVLAAGAVWRISDSRFASLAALAMSAMCLLGPCFCNQLLTETVFTFFLTATVVALVQYHSRPSLRWSLIAGVLLATTVLVRPVPKLLAVPFGLLFLLHATPWSMTTCPIRRVVGHAVAFFAVIAVLLAPWSLRNWVVFGEPFLARLPAVNMWQVCFQGGSAARLPIPDSAPGRRLVALVGGRDGEVPDRYCYAVIGSLEQAGLSNDEIRRLVSEVCFAAIIEHPMDFFWPCFKRFVNFWRTESDGIPGFDAPPPFRAGRNWRIAGIARFHEGVLRRAPSHCLHWNEFVAAAVAAGTLCLVVARRTRAIGLSLGVLFLYFAAVTAAAEVENYRYRMVLEPCMILAVTAGVATARRAGEPDRAPRS